MLEQQSHVLFAYKHVCCDSVDAVQWRVTQRLSLSRDASHTAWDFENNTNINHD